MLTTAEEAATKWCPEVRTGLIAGMAVNRHVADLPGGFDGVYDETRCIGPKCMAWRWNTEARFGVIAPDVGYCGKAGKP
jgi:hypothetical protein